MSKATEASLNEARKRREEKSAELAKTRILGKGITSGSTYHKSGLKKRSDYGSNSYGD